MTTKIQKIRRYWPLLALGLAAIATLVLARLFVSPERFDWPTWIQAVGSIAAILVAVWVSADQSSQQRQQERDREKHEVAGVLRCLQSELLTTAMYIQMELAPKMQPEPGKPIRVVFPLPENPFQIFDGLIPKLGLIPDTRLQSQIIHTYALAKSLVMTTRAHNELVEDLDTAEAAPQQPSVLAAAVRRHQAHATLLAYDQSFRESFQRAKSEIEFLLEALAVACPDE